MTQQLPYCNQCLLMAVEEGSGRHPGGASHPSPWSQQFYCSWIWCQSTNVRQCHFFFGKGMYAIHHILGIFVFKMCRSFVGSAPLGTNWHCRCQFSGSCLNYHPKLPPAGSHRIADKLLAFWNLHINYTVKYVGANGAGNLASRENDILLLVTFSMFLGHSANLSPPPKYFESWFLDPSCMQST